MMRRTIACALAVMMMAVLLSGCPTPKNRIRIKVVNQSANFYGVRLYLSSGTDESPPVTLLTNNLLTGDVDPGDSTQVDVATTTIDGLNANSITLIVQNAAGSLEYSWTRSAGGFEGGTQYALTIKNLGPNDHTVVLTKQ